MTYIRNLLKQKGCVLCREQKRRSGLVIAHGRTCFALLNKYPYNTGHLMVAPYAHKGSLARMTDPERLELVSLTAEMQALLDERMAPQGYNLGINFGRVAGAGVPGHLHLHIVPRWNGDTNFFPITTGVKVMPMALSELRRLLTKKKQTGNRRR